MAENADHKGFYKRGKLPHFDQANQAQFITYRLADSLPSVALAKVMELPREKHTTRILRLLDEGAGNCFLANPQIASMVQENLLHFDGQKYNLHAWAVMPNHVHVLMHCIPGSSMPRIVHSLKSFTAHRANAILERKGQFWQPDYFDVCPKSDEELLTIARYIEYNPVAVGLVERVEDWPYSSAGYRGFPY